MFYLYYNDGSAEIVEMQCRADDGEGLNHVIVEDSVTSIRKYAFGIDEDEDTSLAGITLPNSVTSIGDGAFWNCRRLTSITLPESVTSIGDEAFGGCSGLTSITVAEGNRIYDSRENCNGIIATNTNTLVTGIKTTVIPDSVTSIGDGAFSGCSGLTSIALPNSVTSIGDRAFSRCSRLASITLPDSVTSIGNLAFSRCSGMTSITLPDSLTSIGYGAFNGCSKLTSIIWNGETDSSADAFLQAFHSTRVP